MESETDREWFRSVAAHNTVRVDGMNQAIPVNPFRWDRKPEVTQTDAWTATISYQGITHRRNVNPCRAGFLIVTDEIEGAGGSGGERFIEQFWHTGVEVRMISLACFALERARLQLQPGTLRDWERGREFGWRSRAYGVKEAFTVVRESLRTTLPATLVAGH